MESGIRRGLGRCNFSTSRIMATSALKSSMDGTEASGAHVANRKGGKAFDLVLRTFGVITCLVAVILLLNSKETKTVALTIIPTLPPIDVPVTAKWQYVSAFVYFLVINIIAVVYGVISLVMSIASGGSKGGLGLILAILDLMVMALLFSANGAAAGVGIIAYRGNSHVRWGKICNVFGKNCRIVTASTVLSLIGSLTFFLLVVLTMVNLRRRSH